MEICVIGDSHAAALKSGWEQIRGQTDGHALTFFAAPGDQIGELAVRNDRLVPSSEKLREALIKTSGGRHRIVTARYDVFFLCGLKLTINLLRPGETDASMFAKVDGSPLASALRKLRQCTTRPVVVVPQPFSVRPGGSYSASRRALVFDNACHRLASENASTFLPQPEETRDATGIGTLAKFARSAARLGGGTDDGAHMNADYGAIVLRAAFAALGA